MNSPNSFSSRGKKILYYHSLINYSEYNDLACFIHIPVHVYAVLQLVSIHSFGTNTICAVLHLLNSITYLTTSGRLHTHPERDLTLIMSFNYYVCYHKIGFNFQIIAPPPPPLMNLISPRIFA